MSSRLQKKREKLLKIKIQQSRTQRVRKKSLGDTPKTPLNDLVDDRNTGASIKSIKSNWSAYAETPNTAHPTGKSLESKSPQTADVWRNEPNSSNPNCRRNRKSSTDIISPQSSRYYLQYRRRSSFENNLSKISDEEHIEEDSIVSPNISPLAPSPSGTGVFNSPPRDYKTLPIYGDLGSPPSRNNNNNYNYNNNNNNNTIRVDKDDYNDVILSPNNKLPYNRHLLSPDNRQLLLSPDNNRRRFKAADPPPPLVINSPIVINSPLPNDNSPLPTSPLPHFIDSPVPNIINSPNILVDEFKTQLRLSPSIENNNTPNKNDTPTFSERKRLKKRRPSNIDTAVPKRSLQAEEPFYSALSSKFNSAKSGKSIDDAALTPFSSRINNNNNNNNNNTPASSKSKSVMRSGHRRSKTALRESFNSSPRSGFNELSPLSKHSPLSASSRNSFNFTPPPSRSPSASPRNIRA